MSPKIKAAPTVSPDVTTATGTGNIAKTTALAKAFRLVEITILFSTGTNNNIVITLDALAGVAYDTVLKTIVPGGATSVAWTPEKDVVYAKGDEIKVAWTNDAAYTYGLRIVTEEV